MGTPPTNQPDKKTMQARKEAIIAKLQQRSQPGIGTAGMTPGLEGRMGEPSTITAQQAGTNGNSSAANGTVASRKRKRRKAKAPVMAYQLDSSRALEYRGVVEEEFSRYGPSKSNISLIVRKKGDHPLMAGINPNTWDVEFVLREGMGFIKDKRLMQYLAKRNVEDPIKEMLRDVADHEIGHWEYPRGSNFGCPYDNVSYHNSFIEPVHDELKKSRRFSDGFCEVMSERLSNTITDIIDNYNVSQRLIPLGRPYTGQVLFWFLQGQENGRYTEEFSLFVKMNLALFGSKHDLQLVGRFMEGGKGIGDAAARLKKLFTAERMHDKNSWEMLAREYTKAVLPFLKEDEMPKQIPSPSKGLGKMPPSKGKRQKGGEKGPQDSESGQEQDEEPEEGQEEGGRSGGKGKDEGDKPDGKGGGKGEKEGEPKDDQAGGDDDRLGKDLTPEEMEDIMAGRGAGKGIPFYLKTNDAIDAWYRSRAKRIPLKAKGKLPGASLPIVPLLRRPYDPDEDMPEDADLSKLYVDWERRQIVPGIVTSRLPIEVPLRKENKDMPDFMMTLLDSSFSMMGRGDTSVVPWGDESFYHYGILTWHGLLRFFETERLIHKIKIAGAIFSNETLTAKGLGDVKKIIYNPQTGGTAIDIRKVVEVMRGNNNAVMSLISDGNIGNWDSVREEFISLAKRNQFFMIPIGMESNASIDLRSAGLHVEQPVTSASQIVKMAIDLTAQQYHAAIRGGLRKEAKKYKSIMG